MAGKPQKNLAYSVLLDFYGPVLTVPRLSGNILPFSYCVDYSISPSRLQASPAVPRFFVRKSAISPRKVVT